MRAGALLVAVFLLLGVNAFAQQKSPLDSAINQIKDEDDPKKVETSIKEIIKNFKLEKDEETLDVLYGTAAVNFAEYLNFKEYEKYIALIRNKFNQTSFMNLAASQLLNNQLDAEYAKKISENTLKLYDSYKNDSTARPKNFSKKDWERFMNFAQYPYYDTHAHALFALGQYEEALQFQRKAFMGNPEEGIPSSIERYTKLLALTGKKQEAKELLLKMAKLGKLNKGMTNQLQSIYIGEKGSDENLARFLDSLQKNVQANLIEELKPRMRNEYATAFTLKDIYGKQVKLSDYAGKIVVLDLWATWCKPCIASFPAMELMVKKHPEIAFLFIAVEEKDKNPLPVVKNFIEKGKYPFKVLIDEPVEPNSIKFKIMSSYKPDGIPAKYIIDQKGMLRFNTMGFGTDTELINELEAMFAILKSL